MKRFQKGQSSIEFLFTFAIVIAFLCFYVKIALNYTTGYLVQYATFMSSRSYLVFDNNSTSPQDNDAEALTFSQQNVFNKILTGSTLLLKANHPGETLGSLYTGIYVDFKQNFAFSNLVGGRVPMDMRSESFIGREPTRHECLKRIEDTYRTISGTDNFEFNVTFDDNGC